MAAERRREREACGEPQRESSRILGRRLLTPPPRVAARVAHAQQQLLVQRAEAQLERCRRRVQQRARGVSLGVQQRRLGGGRAAVDALVLERREPAEPAARAGGKILSDHCITYVLSE